MFKRSRQNSKIFIFSQHCYELPERTIRTNWNIYQLFKPENFRGVQNLYQDKATMDKTLSEFKLLSSIRWNERCQHLTIDMKESNLAGRCRLGLNSLLVPNTNTFEWLQMSVYPNVTGQDMINLTKPEKQHYEMITYEKLEFRNKLMIKI